MKKLLTLIAVAMITLSLSAKHYHKPTTEDIEVFKTLTELKAGGDIILPQIYVVAYANQQDTIRSKNQIHEQKRDGTQEGIKKRDRDKLHKQAKPINRTGARPPMQGTTPPRMGTMQRGGRK